MYLKGYDLENSKNKLLHHFDDPLPWKQSKMATKHNYLKRLKLQSHFMQTEFIFTVHINIMLSSLLRRVLQLCFSFILLYYLHFMLVKRIQIIFQIGIKLKKTSPSTNCLVKHQYIHKQHANFQDSAFTQSGALGFYN